MGDDALGFVNELAFPLSHPLEADAGRAAALHADDRGARRARHRLGARRAGGQDAVLERLQAGRALVGRAAAVLALVVALVAALIAWYEAASHVDGWSLWPSILLVALVLMPATFLIVWLALPLADAPWPQLARRLRRPARARGDLLAGRPPDPRELLQVRRATRSSGSCSSRLFQELSWVVLVAALIPLVDAYSVWRGPTNNITEHHAQVFSGVAVSFVVPGGSSAELGLPDVVVLRRCSSRPASASACARSGRGSAWSRACR